MVQVDGILDRVSRLANELKLANLQPQIAACGGLLHRRDGIDVAVFGRFKAGKSSFLNSLTGRAVPRVLAPKLASATARYLENEIRELEALVNEIVRLLESGK